MSEEKRDVRKPILFECAWEVANKFGDRYTLIGPLSYKSAPMEVEAEEPSDPHIASTLDSMRVKGVKCLYGRWLIDGNPHVLLFDTGSQYHRLDEWKGDLWNLAGIPTPPSDHETNESIVFGYVVAWFLGEVRFPHVPRVRANIFSPPNSVSFPAAQHRRYCAFSRMAGWGGHFSLPEATHRRHHHIHDTRDPPRPIPVCWLCRLLQQPSVL